MTRWPSAPIKAVASEVRESIEPSAMTFEQVYHYSIPAFDETGAGLYETPAEIGSAKLLLAGGEVLISKLNPRISRVLLAQSHEVPTVCSTEFIALRLRPELDARFACYWLSSERTRQYLAGATLSVTRSQQRVRPDVLMTSQIPAPSLDDQGAIADYLDRETARIDALITAKRRTTELLADRLGLTAHNLTMSTGDSVPLRRLIRSVKTGTTPPASDFARLDTGTVPWYSPGDVGEWLQLFNAARTLKAEAITEGWVPQFPPQSTLLVGIGATAGKVAFLDHAASGNQQMTCLVPGPRVIPRFLSWQLFARRDEIRATAPFTTLPILNNEFIRSLPIMVPPLSRQEQVVSHLDDAVASADALAARARKQVALLQERRQALITAAVTGQLHTLETA